MHAAFIDDGYTIEHTLPADSDWHPPLTIAYRPLLHAARARLLQQIGKCEDAGRGEELAAAGVAGQLVSWELADRQGVPVPINAINVGRLESHLFARLFSVVAGLSPAAQAAESASAKN